MTPDALAWTTWRIAPLLVRIEPISPTTLIRTFQFPFARVHHARSRGICVCVGSHIGEGAAGKTVHGGRTGGVLFATARNARAEVQRRGDAHARTGTRAG